MTVSSDVSQLLGFLGKFLNELPLGNRSGASGSTRDSSFADHLRQLATGSAHMADTPVSQRTPPLQAPVQAQAAVVAAPVQAQTLPVAAAPVQAQATSVAPPVQAQTLSVAPPAASTSQAGAKAVPPARPLSVESQEFFSTLEMNSCGGSVSFCNLTGNSATVLNVGDTWQFSILGGPPNTPIKQLMDCSAYPPDYKTVGTTDAHGNFTLTGTVTDGSQVWQPFCMEFPNTYPGYQDPTASTGYRNVFIGGVEFTVQQSQS